MTAVLPALLILVLGVVALAVMVLAVLAVLAMLLMSWMARMRIGCRLGGGRRGDGKRERGCDELHESLPRQLGR
ncbi:hypothetical protein [Allosphingosinicella sp.]|jgi:hypothetical protein|uniref:hypothetical protein n=1 Tax=Allosphingosinicella sp. TaxID=2823234 RepID=UPI002EF8FB07